jgi:hypothetical protein
MKCVLALTNKETYITFSKRVKDTDVFPTLNQAVFILPEVTRNFVQERPVRFSRTVYDKSTTYWMIDVGKGRTEQTTKYNEAMKFIRRRKLQPLGVLLETKLKAAQAAK